MKKKRREYISKVTQRAKLDARVKFRLSSLQSSLDRWNMREQFTLTQEIIDNLKGIKATLNEKYPEDDVWLKNITKLITILNDDWYSIFHGDNIHPLRALNDSLASTRAFLITPTPGNAKKIITSANNLSTHTGFIQRNPHLVGTTLTLMAGAILLASFIVAFLFPPTAFVMLTIGLATSAALFTSGQFIDGPVYSAQDAKNAVSIQKTCNVFFKIAKKSPSSVIEEVPPITPRP